MRADDVTITEGGKRVSVRLLCRDRNGAIRVWDYAEEFQPQGYVLLAVNVARRVKGGRTRTLALVYRHTGNETFPPMSDWRDWRATLKGEASLARVAKHPLDRNRNDSCLSGSP